LKDPYPKDCSNPQNTPSVATAATVTSMTSVLRETSITMPSPNAIQHAIQIDRAPTSSQR